MAAGSDGAIPARPARHRGVAAGQAHHPLDRNKQLADENTRLRRSRRALGDQRSAKTRIRYDRRSKTARIRPRLSFGDIVHEGTPQVTALADAKAQDNDPQPRPGWHQ